MSKARELSVVPQQSIGFKNRIINGAMQIDQRNAGASVTIGSADTYTLDRWGMQQSQASKYSVQQNAGSVTLPTGFSNYLGITSLSAYSVGSGDYFDLYQKIEGYNIADLGWGTANAQSVTLSFQVRSSLTGTFGGVLQNSASNRSYPFTYSISSANTWTSISVTIAGDTSGTWLTTNGIGIQVRFGLGVGSTYSGTAGSWAGANYISATGATSVVGTNGATFYITGVQLEKGSNATSFDYRPYTTELQLCQRYVWKCSADGNVNQIGWAKIASTSTRQYGFFQYPVTMRTTPSSISYSNLSVGTYYGAAGVNVTSVTIDANTIGSNTASLIMDTGSSLGSAGTMLLITSQGGGTGYVLFNAEL